MTKLNPTTIKTMQDQLTKYKNDQTAAKPYHISLKEISQWLQERSK